MPDIREAAIEIRFIAQRAIGNLVKFFNPHPNKIGHNRVLELQYIHLVVFGRKAKKLAKDLGVAPNNLLDTLTPDELILLQELKDTAMRLIDIQDMHPEDAIQKTTKRLLIQVQSRYFKLK